MSTATLAVDKLNKPIFDVFYWALNKSAHAEFPRQCFEQKCLRVDNYILCV